LASARTDAPLLECSRLSALCRLRSRELWLGITRWSRLASRASRGKYSLATRRRSELSADCRRARLRWRAQMSPCVDS
jgi:hypothetical protein